MIRWFFEAYNTYAAASLDSVPNLCDNKFSSDSTWSSRASTSFRKSTQTIGRNGIVIEIFLRYHEKEFISNLFVTNTRINGSETVSIKDNRRFSIEDRFWMWFRFKRLFLIVGRSRYRVINLWFAVVAAESSDCAFRNCGRVGQYFWLITKKLILNLSTSSNVIVEYVLME